MSDKMPTGMPTNDDEILRQNQIAESSEWRQREEIWPDLRAYLKQNTVPLVSLEEPEIDYDLQVKLKANAGLLFENQIIKDKTIQVITTEDGHHQITYNPEFYIDGRGGISKFTVNSEKVIPYKIGHVLDSMVDEKGGPKNLESYLEEKNRQESNLKRMIGGDMKGLGFENFEEVQDSDGKRKKELYYLYIEINKVLRAKKNRLEKESNEQKKKEFDF